MNAGKRALQFIRRFSSEHGAVAFLAVIMVVMLLFSGLAFMRWGTDEGWEATYREHQLQAYYCAHAGVMSQGMTYLRNLNASALAPQRALLGEENITNNNNQIVGKADVYVQPAIINEGGIYMSDFNYVNVIGVGEVNFQDDEGNNVAVHDSATVTVKLLSISNFLYLTNYETTIFGEVIKFWGADTLNGWVHSNDTISMMGGGGGPGPVFYDHVSTAAPIINVISGTPQYLGGPPWLNYREIVLPTTAEEIRNAAAAAGLFFQDGNGQYAHRLVFNDNQGWTMYRWPMGAPFADTVIASGPPPTWQAIFVDGYLEMQGKFRGQLTVGAAGNAGFMGKHCIRLMDNVYYWFADSTTGLFNDTTGNFTDILGIVSEGDIVVANTWENGRDNGKTLFPGNFNRHTIIITAALVALGESFTFEDQNDNNLWEYSTGYLGPNQDARGDIRIAGSLTQFRRGYVHRNNHGAPGGGPQGDTGYGKDYDFDARLNNMAPPYFIQAQDAEGDAHFEIVAWNHGND